MKKLFDDQAYPVPLGDSLPGMSLVDYFAAKMLSQLYSNTSVEGLEYWAERFGYDMDSDEQILPEELFPKIAYEFAKGMMEERKRLMNEKV